MMMLFGLACLAIAVIHGLMYVGHKVHEGKW